MFHYLLRLLCSWPLAFLGYFLSLFKFRRKMKDPIDFVVLWIDENDSTWSQTRATAMRKFKPESAAIAPERFRDWENFHYWFRAVEKFAPWCRYIHLVTDCQPPSWLNLSHPKIRFVRHEEIMPADALPSFNASAIESCIRNIPDLSEHFVYFNDDMFLTSPVCKEDFFQAGKPVLCSSGTFVREYPGAVMFNHLQFSTLGTVNSLDWKSWMWRHPSRWFSHKNGIGLIHNIHSFQQGFLSGVAFPHLATPMRKSTHEMAWQWMEDRLSKTVSHHFRHHDDVYQQLFTLTDMYRGDFVPCSRSHLGRFFLLDSQDQSVDEFCASLPLHRYRCSCLNDSHLVKREGFQTCKHKILGALGSEFPDKSSFEL